MNDLVNHPPHYNVGAIEVIDVIENFGLGFHLGNVVKYVLRSAYKGSMLEDLKKSRWYLDREIARLETEEAAHQARWDVMNKGIEKIVKRANRQKKRRRK